MKYKAIAINPHDGFDLVAVWEKNDRKWYLLQLARPQSAITLAQEKSKERLVFPTEVNPNKLHKKRCQKNASRE